MNRRNFLAGISAAALTSHQTGRAVAQGAASSPTAATARKGVMLMNRIGPSSSDLYIANADGTGERKLLQNSVFEYNASFAPDGKSVVFTSERNGDGQSDVFRARSTAPASSRWSRTRRSTTRPCSRPTGRGSPSSRRATATARTSGCSTSKSGQLRNLTGGEDVQGDPSGPNGFFRPSWSPDGQWLAFSSDRNTDWRGHSGGHGWEHTQELSIYVIGADGQGFRRIASKPGYSLGSPKWSPDGKRVVFYEMTTEDTWGARRPNLVAKVVSQIVSVDVATGERVEHTSGPG